MSARKTVLIPFKLVSGQSMASTVTSAAVNVQYLDNIAFQAIFTGTPTGTFSVQVSLDHQENFVGTGVVTPGTWTNLTLSPVPAATGAAGSVVIDLNQISAPWVRLVYTPTSGTGTLNAYVSGKQL